MQAFMQRIRKKCVIGLVGGSDLVKIEEQMAGTGASLPRPTFSRPEPERAWVRRRERKKAAQKEGRAREREREGESSEQRASKSRGKGEEVV